LVGAGGTGGGGGGGGDDGGGAGGGGAGLLAAVEFATVNCTDLSTEAPLESETEMPNVKLPLAVGVPEMIPLLLSMCTPCGSWPDTTAKL
jgi:hypothetical protein